MEENSYSFVRKHRLLPGDTVPAGYRATWSDKDQLAGAKLAATMGGKDRNFNNLLLSCDGDRANDKFMEVHIYGALDWQSLEKLALPKVKSKKAKVAFIGIKKYIKKYNMTCEEL
jgi:hypothetical protein